MVTGGTMSSECLHKWQIVATLEMISDVGENWYKPVVYAVCEKCLEKREVK